MCDGCKDAGAHYSRRFADLYLEARDRTSSNAMAVPHEVLAPVFNEAGWGHVVPGLGGSDWYVRPSSNGKTTLYTFKPTLVEDTSVERERLAELLAAAGVGTQRFIEVVDGQKGRWDTDGRPHDDPELAGNYGVLGGRGGRKDGPWLVDIDVDDHNEAKQSHERVDKLREETLAVASAHTTVDRPGHLYVAVDGDPRAVVRDLLGREVNNPAASFGEIRVENQYVVGPGSAVLCGCDQCSPADAAHDHGVGRYEFANEQQPLVWTEDEFREFLLADPAINREAAAAEAATADRDAQSDGSPTSAAASDRPTRREGSLDGDASERLEHAKTVDPDVRDALEELEDPADRSKADARFASTIASYVDYDEDALREILGEYGTKWQTRPDESYRQSIVNYALRQSASDGKLTSALPLGRLGALQPDEQRRYLRKRGVDWPSNDEVTDRIRETVYEHMADEDTVIVEAPTGANKTGVAAETKWREVDDDVTGGRPVVLFCETRDARDEALERAKAAGLDENDILDLYGRKERCDLAVGVYDPANIDEDDPDAPEPVLIEGQPASEWFDEMCSGRGLPFSGAHAEAKHLLNRQGRACPCCEGDYLCDSQVQWPSGGLTDDDDVPRFDLVIATDLFAHVPSLRANTNVIHDEQPDYTEDFGLDSSDYGGHEQYLEALNSRIRRAITSFLGLTEDGPDTFEDFVTLARQCATFDARPWNEHAGGDEKPRAELAERWLEIFDALGHEPSRSWYFADERAHTLAPALARGIWKAIINNGIDGEPGTGPFDQNGRASATVRHDPPRLDEDARDDDGWNRTYVSVVVNETNEIRRVRNAPDFSTTRSVVGLDARPTPWLWQRNVHPDMTTDAVLETDERRLWRRFERGQTVVRVGDAIRPAGKDGRYFTPAHARAIIEKLRDYGGEDFNAAGCPSGFEEGIRELLRDAGVPEDAIATMHFGEEKSRNDFADRVLGLVYGCIDPGDDYVLDWLAECGLEAAPERTDADCESCDGDGCHACDGTGHPRAHGRGFTGPDADHAAELLGSVRETHVAQMVGRFGRSLDVDAGERNITFVATAAVPEDLVDYHADGVIATDTDLQREIVGELEDRPSATTREIADAVDCDKEHVRQTLVALEEREDTGVRRARGVGPHGADIWRRSGSGPTDNVQLRLDEITNDGVRTPNTWSLAINRPDVSQSDSEAVVAALHSDEEAAAAVDPPDRPVD